MTGFGDAAALHEGVQYKLELRAVNNKFLKPVFRIPDKLQVLEPWIESQLRARLHRGTITVSITFAEADERSVPEINASVLKHYAEQIAGALDRDVASINPVSLIQLPGVLAPRDQSESFLDNARAALTPLISEAVDHLISMRTREGMGLSEDLIGRMDEIAVHLERVAELAPAVSAEYERRLHERLTRLVEDYSVDAEPADLVREVAVYAEKTDIAEEIARLREHLVHFRELVESDDPKPVGRTLDFLAQELLREANTIASKSPDTEISRRVVEVKGAIDRIKEQVQNAE